MHIILKSHITCILMIDVVMQLETEKKLLLHGPHGNGKAHLARNLAYYLQVWISANALMQRSVMLTKFSYQCRVYTEWSRRS